MREILFRGKDDESGKFVYGYYGLERDMRKIPFILKPSISWEEDDILFSSFVIPETIGQYTGWKDKNGKMIFEGDIFVDEEAEVTSVVEFRNGMFCLVDYGIRGTLTPYGYDESAGGFGECGYLPMDNYCIDEMEIDGNIYDNPEMLKGEGKE